MSGYELNVSEIMRRGVLKRVKMSGYELNVSDEMSYVYNIQFNI